LEKEKGRQHNGKETRQIKQRGKKKRLDEQEMSGETRQIEKEQ